MVSGVHTEEVTGSIPVFRRSGEDYAAALTEIGGASGLLSTGRFGEHDAVVSALAERHRAEGPLTLLYVALTLLGYSAFFQGEPERAGRLFDESAGIDVPDRTISVNAPIDARSAFRRGDRPRACRILRSHVDELLRTGNTDIAGNAAVEFINMMASVDRLQDAARVLGYLVTAGDFGALAARTLVADAAAKIATAAEPELGSEQRPGHQLDAVKLSNLCATSSTSSPSLNTYDCVGQASAPMRAVLREVRRYRGAVLRQFGDVGISSGFRRTPRRRRRSDRAGSRACHRCSASVFGRIRMW